MFHYSVVRRTDCEERGEREAFARKIDPTKPRLWLVALRMCTKVGANIGPGRATVRFDAHRADIIASASVEFVLISYLIFGLTNWLKMSSFTFTLVTRLTVAHKFGRFER